MSRLAPVRFSSRMRLALHLMLEGQSSPAVCEAVGVKPWTLHRWMAHPEWTAQWDAERAVFGLTDAQLAQRARRALLLQAADATQTIGHIRRKGQNERNRLAAALQTYKYAVGVAHGPGSLVPTVPVEVLHRLAEAIQQHREARDITPAAAHLPADDAVSA